MIKRWSLTLRWVALSLCEGELYSVRKVAAETLGMKSSAEEMGMPFNMVLKATLEVVNRRHTGKVHHSSTQEL